MSNVRVDRLHLSVSSRLSRARLTLHNLVSLRQELLQCLRRLDNGLTRRGQGVKASHDVRSLYLLLVVRLLQKGDLSAQVRNGTRQGVVRCRPSLRSLQNKGQDVGSLGRLPIDRLSLGLSSSCQF